MDTLTSKEGTTSRWTLAVAVAAAAAASVCCIGPLVLLALGVSGAWASGLRALEPYRPIFIVLTLGFLGFGFYRAYRAPANMTCSADGWCRGPRSSRASRVALWVMTPIILALLAFPFIARHLSGGASSKGVTVMDTKQAVLSVQNLTCGSCTAATRNSLLKVDGVKDANVTLDPPRAVVDYDPAKVSLDALTRATADAGFPSTVQAQER